MRRPVLVAGVATCLLIAACFAISVRGVSAREEARERIALAGVPTPAEAARTEAALDRAATLNPDTEVTYLRALFALQRRQPEEARDLMLDIVRREPANAETWSGILLAFGERDAALRTRARAALMRLGVSVPES